MRFKYWVKVKLWWPTFCNQFWDLDLKTNLGATAIPTMRPAAMRGNFAILIPSSAKTCAANMPIVMRVVSAMGRAALVCRGVAMMKAMAASRTIPKRQRHS